MHRCTKKFCRFFQRIGKYLTEFHLTPPQKYFLDLKAVNKQELLDFGIPEHHIEVSHECTFESPQKYFSYRRTGEKANFVCGIAIK